RKASTAWWPPSYCRSFTSSRTPSAGGSRGSAQRGAENLAGGRLGDLVDEDDLLGALVAGQPGLAVGDEVVLLHRAAGGDDDERLHRLPRVGVGHADHGGLLDAGVLEEDLLDLGGEHVEAGHDDEVLDPVDKVEVPVVVHDGDVAGVEPPVVVEGAGGGLRVAPVAGEHV